MPTQTFSEQPLIEKIHTLPPEKVCQVADFAGFLAEREEKAYDAEAYRFAQDGGQSGDRFAAAPDAKRLRNVSGTNTLARRHNVALYFFALINQPA